MRIRGETASGSGSAPLAGGAAGAFARVFCEALSAGETLIAAHRANPAERGGLIDSAASCAGHPDIGFPVSNGGAVPPVGEIQGGNEGRLCSIGFRSRAAGRARKIWKRLTGAG